MDDFETTTATVNAHDGERERVARFFGQVRAEYASDEEIFELFSTPAYWDALVGIRPCFLVGGRGTGKTTALKGLSFRGQARLNGEEIADWSTVGAYLRIQTNVVSAFQGKRLSDDEWAPFFGHYLNLQLSDRVFDFLQWRGETIGIRTNLSEEYLQLFADSLGITFEWSHDDPEDMLRRVRRALQRQAAKLEFAVNNPRRLHEIDVSALGVPIGHLTGSLQTDTALKGREFLFAIDEYENLRPYQQAVVNTLVKHVGDAPYTIKVGVRDSEGWNRETLAPGQYLTAPADFEVVDIVRSLPDGAFAQFARSICASRLRAIGGADVLAITKLFPGMSIADEAEHLGVQAMLDRAAEGLVKSGADEDDLAAWYQMPRLEQAMIPYWAESSGSPLLSVLREALAAPRKWTTRTNNYSYALLFTIRRRVRGTRKYYAGWSVYMHLAAGNIRYALQLVHEALSQHLRNGGTLLVPIPVELQTKAAAAVGHRMLRELQGSSPEGGSLTKLALGLGRVFGVMAAEPHGHAPEVNQFRVDRASSVYDEHATEGLLREAVAQGCLVSFDGNKRASVSGETANFDYQLHPIFSAYFVVGHRSKRRMTLRASDLLALANDRTGSTVKSLLAGSAPRASGDLPPQLAIYGEVFDED